MLNTTKLSIVLAAAQILVTLTPALAKSTGAPKSVVILSSASISTGNGGRAEAQKRLLANGTKITVLTEYDQKGMITKQTVWPTVDEQPNPVRQQSVCILRGSN